MAIFGRKKNIFEEAYFPDRYVNRITDLDSDFFTKEDIKGVIIDVDNTVIDVKKNLIDGLVEWRDELKAKGIDVVILSNTIDKIKVSKIADLLDVDYFTFGRKPNTGGFMKAKRHLELDVENIAVIGDQIFTDVLGANRAGMLSVLVNPLHEHNDYFITKWKRPLEEKVLTKYLKHIEEKEKNPEKYQHVLRALEQRLENQEKENDTSHTTKLSKVVKAAKEKQKKEFSEETESKKKINDEIGNYQESFNTENRFSEYIVNVEKNEKENRVLKRPKTKASKLEVKEEFER